MRILILPVAEPPSPDVRFEYLQIEIEPAISYERRPASAARFQRLRSNHIEGTESDDVTGQSACASDADIAKAKHVTAMRKT